VRTCVACRRRAPSRELFRVAGAPGHEVVIDWRRNLGGRGAYVCATRACIDRAVKRRLFDRTLKQRVQYPDSTALIGTARKALERRVATLLATALGATGARPGVEAAREALAAGQARYLLVAEDSANRAHLIEAAAGRGVPVGEVPTKASLGKLARGRDTGAIAITDDGLGAAIRNVWEQLATLS